jgi:OOP family OmpA-OmpF porin
LTNVFFLSETIFILASQILDRMKKELIVTVLLNFVFGIVSAQESTYGLPKAKNFDRWSAGISAGPAIFQGDILKDSYNNNAWTKIPFNPAYGAHVNFQITHSVGIKLRGMLGKLSGEHSEQAQSNSPIDTEFETPLSEVTLNAVYTLGNISFLKRNKRFHVYFQMGIGIFSFDSEYRLKKIDTNNDGKTDTNKDSLIGTRSSTEFMLPAGLGFKYNITNRIDIGLSADYRRTFTDKVDVLNRPTTEYDGYSLICINANYTFGKRKEQLEWVNPMEVVYNDLGEIKDRMDVMSNDKDKDGVSDMFDKDNSTPEGTKVYGDGTTVDTDGDGVGDASDADPYSTKGAKVDGSGSEADDDSDGVPNSRDKEPNTSPGSLVNFQGITIPVNDTSASTTVINGYLPSVYFDTDKSSIKPMYHDRLQLVARVLKNNPDLVLTITGHCDVEGSDEPNLKLGMRRAEAARSHLIKVYGIGEGRIFTETKGEAEQFAKNLNPMNRRVDFSVSK